MAVLRFYLEGVRTGLTKRQIGNTSPPLEGEGAGRERLIMAVLRSSLEGVRTGLTKRQIGNTSPPLQGEGRASDVCDWTG